MNKPNLLFACMLIVSLFSGCDLEHRKLRPQERKAQEILLEFAEIEERPVSQSRVGLSGRALSDKLREEWEERRNNSNIMSERRKSAEAQLELLGPEIAGFLAQNLNSSSPDVGIVCANVLASFGKPAVRPILKVIHDKGKAAYAKQALQQMGSVVVPALIDALKDGDEDQQQVAADTLSYLVMPSNDFNFRRLRRDSHMTKNQLLLPTDDIVTVCKQFPQVAYPKVRISLVELLGKVGPRLPIVTDTLANAAMHDAEAQVRIAAIDSLGMITTWQVDPAAAPNIRTICEVLANDEIEECKIEAAKILGGVDKCDNIRIPALIAALKQPNIAVVLAAMDALSQIGPRAKIAVSDMKKVIDENKSSDVLAPALKAISKVGGEDTIPLITSFISNDDRRIQTAAIDALANYTDGAPQALNTLLPILESEQDMSVRWAIIRAIEKMGKKGKPAADALRKDLEKFTHDRGFINSAFRSIGEPIEPFKPNESVKPIDSVKPIGPAN